MIRLGNYLVDTRVLKICENVAYEVKENRKYKDTVFVDMLTKWKGANGYQLMLYNALHGTNYKIDEVEFENVSLNNVFYLGINNDVALKSMVKGKRKIKTIIFAEHQSTINENMPARILLYAGRIYENEISAEQRYRKKMIKIAKPEFYVFYNGEDDYPTENELRLSDAYRTSEDNEVSLELVARVININLNKQHPILEKCPFLKEYMQLVEMVRINRKNNEKDAIGKAVRECMKQGILKEYLAERGKEVENMLFGEYDYDMDIAVQREEAEEIGEERGIEIGKEIGESTGQIITKINQIVRKLEKGKLINEIANDLEEDETYIEKLINLIKANPDKTSRELSKMMVE